MSQLSTQLIQKKSTWEQFILSRAEANFLQSWNWGEFHQNLGKKIFPLALMQSMPGSGQQQAANHHPGNLSQQPAQQIGAALIIKETAKRGNYLTIAGGPLLDWQATTAHEQLQFFFQEIKKIAQAENCLFIRIRPQELENESNRHLVEQLSLQESPMHLTADLTLQLDLTLNENALLKNMRKNTRYEVRKADKLGIKVEISDNPEDIKTFHQHQLVLAKKHDFIPFSYKFLHEQFLSFAQDQQVLLFHSYLPVNQTDSDQAAATTEKQLLASAFIIFYNREAVYHYGISTPTNQRLPGSYACQWAAIKEAKRRGCLRYNFWGIAPKEDKAHRFAGVSLFKRGFGGEEVPYLPAHDLPVSKLYMVTKGFEQMRKKMRKL